MNRLVLAIGLAVLGGVIIGGIIFATLVTLLVVPVLYRRLAPLPRRPAPFAARPGNILRDAGTGCWRDRRNVFSR